MNIKGNVAHRKTRRRYRGSNFINRDMINKIAERKRPFWVDQKWDAAFERFPLEATLGLS